MPTLGDVAQYGGPWAIVGFAVVAVLRGWLVPRMTVALLIKRADDYKEAWERSEEARQVTQRTVDLQAQQMDKLLEYARTADSVLRSFSRAREAA